MNQKPVVWAMGINKIGSAKTDKKLTTESQRGSCFALFPPDAEQVL